MTASTSGDILGHSYGEDVVAEILKTPSLLDTEGNMVGSSAQGDWNSLAALKKLQVKIALHGTIMTLYLRANSAPNCLIVQTAPRIFLDDPVFRREWSQITWKCTRDWLILIIGTAKRLSEALIIKINIAENGGFAQVPVLVTP